MSSLSQIICVDCGTPIEEDEEQHCPNCDHGPNCQACADNHLCPDLDTERDFEDLYDGDL